MVREEGKGQDKQLQIMLKTPVKPLVAKLAFPTVISLLITSFYSLADGFFVARVGASQAENVAASGAVGVVFSVMALIQALGFTFGTGAGSMVSRSLGGQEKERANRVALSACLMALLSGILLTVVGLVFLEPLLRLLGATDTVLPFAKPYARYIFIGAPVMTAVFVLSNLLRAEGKTGLSMVGLAMGALLNIALDPLFLFVWDMGISGASLATLVSQSCALVFFLFCFLSKRTTLTLHPRFFTLRPGIYGEIFLVGLPSVFRQGLASIAAIMLNNAAAQIGDAALSAMSIVNKIFLFMFSIALGIGQAYQPVVGYNYSAGEKDRVREAFRFAFVSGTLLLLLVGAIVFFFAPYIVGVMIRRHREVMAIGVMALRFQCLAMPFVPLNVVCNMTFQSVGKRTAACFLAACRQGVFFLPLIFFLPRFFSLTGVVLAQPIADLLTALMSLPFAVSFLRGMKKERADV